MSKLKVGDIFISENKFGLCYTYIYCGIIKQGQIKRRLIADIEMVKDADLNAFSLVEDEWTKYRRIKVLDYNRTVNRKVADNLMETFKTEVSNNG